MADLLIAHESRLRLGAFLVVLAAMAIWEVVSPRRRLQQVRTGRWVGNLGIMLLNTVLIRVLLPVTAVGVAHLGATRGFGLLNQWMLPVWPAVIATVVAMDLVIYLQHRAFHAVPLLWRVHRMHHADLDVDVTTGARFHPLEIVLSMFIKLIAVLLLGASPLGVLLFEILLNATSMFNHSNVRMPLPVEGWLRSVIVTPDMHRIHHSAEWSETNRNFGFNLPWWDRLLGTYGAEPRSGHEAMTIGLREHRDRERCTTLRGMLAMPFIRAGDAA